MKTVMITGANRGIGLGFCRHFLQQGWRVIALVRNDIRAEKLADIDIEKKQHLYQLHVDLTDEQAIKASVNTVSKICAKLDLLINNAGVSMNQAFGYWNQKAFLDSYQVNAVAPALLVQAYEYYFHKDSKIIQLTSGLASIENNINPLGPFDAYSMSKVALNMLTRRLAKQFESQHVVVCSLSPGWVQTDMGGIDAPMDVEDTIPLLIATINNLTQADSGGAFDEHGNEIAW